MIRHPYSGPRDIARLQEFTARQIRTSGRIGMMHPGEVPHRIFNRLRRDSPYELVHLWEDDAGEIAAWVLLDPRGAGFDLQIAAGLRRTTPDLEREIVQWSEETVLGFMRAAGSGVRNLDTAAFADDPVRTKLLAGLGWLRMDIESLMLGRRSLTSLARPELPPGYRIRCVHGVEEAGPVAALHSAGFGTFWTAQLYRRVMESPGYSLDRELVVEAGDRSLVGFCIIWPDEMNRIGCFEPLAVHPDHRRRGLGTALLRAGMAEMKSWGLESVDVTYEEDNPGSGPLYRSEGFKPLWRLDLYRKPISL